MMKCVLNVTLHNIFLARRGMLEAVPLQKCLMQDSVLAEVATALLDSHIHQEKAANCHPYDVPAFAGTYQTV